MLAPIPTNAPHTKRAAEPRRTRYAKHIIQVDTILKLEDGKIHEK